MEINQCIRVTIHHNVQRIYRETDRPISMKTRYVRFMSKVKVCSELYNYTQMLEDGEEYKTE